MFYVQYGLLRKFIGYKGYGIGVVGVRASKIYALRVKYVQINRN